jgi:hypothetical protein
MSVMAQGKAFTKEERERIIESLRPYLEMGFSRNKSCRFIGLDPTTLSKWVVDDESLSMKLVSWENVNTALALANIHQALKNESILATEKGDIRMENSWKVVSKLEEGYKDKLDVTSDGRALPQPILHNVIPSDNSNQEDSQTV